MDTLKAISGAIAGTVLMLIAAVMLSGLPSYFSSKDSNDVASSSVSPSTQQAASVLSNPIPSRPAPAPAPVALATHEAYVASEDAEVFVFSVGKGGDFMISMAIEGEVPLDVYAAPGTLTTQEWIFNAASSEVFGTIGVFTGEKAQDIFSGPWSKKAAFRQFESPWVRLEPGQYYIALDNTSAFTPTRGDAFVRLSIYGR